MRHGSKINPPNRFETQHRELDLEHVEWDEEYLRQLEHREIEYIPDASKSIVVENSSPDIPFRYSVNPYRGCIHGCAYCYARPGHEFLGLNAGLEFETKIIFKKDAAVLLRTFLRKKSWQAAPIIFSGVTDCYQPAERKFRLTRGCLEVAVEARQPVGLITKNALILRDLDLLKNLAADNLVQVFVSITTLDPSLARDMEPRTSIPDARLRTIKMLANAGVPIGVMVAPLIPGLTDNELPQILKAASQAGAVTAHYTLLRLPLSVEPVFKEWLTRTQPLKSERVLGRIEATRDGKLNDTRWGQRMVGTGEIADQIRTMFQVFRKKYRLDREMSELDNTRFRRPEQASDQMRLF